MFTHFSRGVRRVACLCVVAMTVAATAPMALAGAATSGPLPVTPYAGNSPTLTRAPYVTDLTQTSAYVNWATNVSTPGSLQFAPVGSGGCPASVTTWSTAAGPLPVPSTIPYQAPPSKSTTISWSFTVLNGAGTTINEYQASVLVKGLSPGTSYCYAVFSKDKAGATDLLPPSTNPALHSLAVQSFTTLLAPSATSAAPVTFDVLDDTGENYACTTANNCTTDVPFNTSGPPVNPDEASLYNQIGQSGAQFLLDAGDTGYNNGSQTNLGDLQQTGTTTDVSNFFGPSYEPLTGGIPIFSASGDHNQNNTALKVFPTPTNAANSGGSYSYAPVTNVDGITGSAPADWYAYTTGNVRIYVIDAAWGESATSGKLGTTTGSLCGAVGSSAAAACQPYQADNVEHWQTSSAEYQWLLSDLSSPSHAGLVKFAVFHFPLQSDSSSQPSDLYAQNSAANPSASTSLEAMLAKNGVEMAFNGHAHTYQRFDPTQPGRIVNYVTGGGGGVLGSVQGQTTAACKALVATNTSVYAIGWAPSSNTGSACGSAPVPTSASQVYNFLKVSVSGNSITVSPTNAAGQVFDQQTYTDTAVSPPPTPTTPGSVTATAPTSTSVQLSWTASTESGGTIASYAIDRNGAPLTSVPGTATSYTDPSVLPSTAYTYTVTAVDGSGNLSSPGTSNQVTTPPSTPPPNTFSISASPNSATVTAGSPATSTITTAVTSGVAQSVALTATGAPTGALVSFNPQVITAGQTSVMTVTTSVSTPVATTPITVTGTGTSTTQTTGFSLTVNAPAADDFSISAAPNSATVTAGSPATSTITTSVTSGSAQSVALSATGAPTGALVSFNPQVITSGQTSVMTVTTSVSTPASTLAITVTGTGVSATHTTGYSLTVNAASATPQLVQIASGTETAAATTLTAAFPTPTTAGDLLVLSASEYNGATNHITSVTDSAGDLWTHIGSYDVSGHNSNGEMWYSPDAAAVTTVTLHSASAVSEVFEVEEFSGVATSSALDVSTGTSATSVSPNSGSVSSTVPDELAVGFIAGHGNAEPITVTSSGYTDQPQQTTTGTIATVVTGYQVVGTPGSQSFAGSIGSAAYWAAGVAIFKPAG